MTKRAGAALFLAMAALFLVANRAAYKGYFQDDEINNLATNKNCQQDRTMHEGLGIPGFDYRPEWPADRSMCTSSGNGKYTFCSDSFEAMRLEMAHVPGLLFTSSLQELSGEESACIPAVLDAP